MGALPSGGGLGQAGGDGGGDDGLGQDGGDGDDGGQPLGTFPGGLSHNALAGTDRDYLVGHDQDDLLGDLLSHDQDCDYHESNYAGHNTVVDYTS